MKTILLIAGMFLTLCAFSQNSNIDIYTNISDAKFKVNLNGELQNTTFQSKMHIDGLSMNKYSLRIQFENLDAKTIDKTLEVNHNMSYTFEIIAKSDAKQKLSKFGNKMARDLTLRERDSIALKDLYQLKLISRNLKTNSNVNNFSSGNNNTSSNMGSNNTGTTNTDVNSSTNVSANTNVNTSVTSYSTTTTVNETPTKSSANLNVNSGGVNLNINVSDNNSGVSQQTYTSTTTTNSADHYVMPNYSGPVGCPWPMNNNDFLNAKNSIVSKSFEDSKLTIAKQIINNNCLTSAQVRELLKLFDFEDTKLDFAKYCYGYTFDIGNYYQVNDAFDFESSIEELNNYINSR